MIKNDEDETRRLSIVSPNQVSLNFLNLLTINLECK